MRTILSAVALGYLVYDAFVFGNALGGDRFCTPQDPSGGIFLNIALTLISVVLLVPMAAHADGMPSAFTFLGVLSVAILGSYVWIRGRPRPHVSRRFAAVLAGVCAFAALTSRTHNCF